MMQNRDDQCGKANIYLSQAPETRNTPSSRFPPPEGFQIETGARNITAGWRNGSVSGSYNSERRSGLYFYSLTWLQDGCSSRCARTPVAA
jgi:hypothetical protein